MPTLSPEVLRERRQRLVAAAWRCAARTGYCDMTVDDICAEAGVSKGSFYSHFNKREDVLVDIVEQDTAAMEERILAIGQSVPPGLHRLRETARLLLRDGEDEGLMQVRADMWAEALCEIAIRDQFREALRRRRARLTAMIEESMATGELMADIPARSVAVILLAAVDGLTFHAAIDSRGVRWPNVRRGIDRLLAGIGTPVPG